MIDMTQNEQVPGIMIAFMQPKGPQAKYNNVILGSFKFIQLILSLVCTMVHMYSYWNHKVNMPHVTIFCGTYAGYVIVSAGMFMGYIVRYRATPEMDLYYCFVGGLLYNIAGIVSMHLAQRYGYAHDRDGNIYVDRSFLDRCAAHSMLSMVTGMLYWIDFFINLDIWWGVRNRTGDKREYMYSTGDIRMFQVPEKRRTVITEADELELHCVCLELAHGMKQVVKRLLQKETYEFIFRSKDSDPEYDIEEFLQIAAEESARDSRLRLGMDDFRDSPAGRYRGVGGVHSTSLHRIHMLRS